MSTDIYLLFCKDVIQYFRLDLYFQQCLLSLSPALYFCFTWYVDGQTAPRMDNVNVLVSKFVIVSANHIGGVGVLDMNTSVKQVKKIFF